MAILCRLSFEPCHKEQPVLNEGEPSSADIVEVDATGLDCPMPLLLAKRALNSMTAGQSLRVRATDQGSVRDFKVFASQSGHRLLASDEADGIYTYLLQKTASS
jgi:TusA-related sulfurtransferase